MPTLTLLRVPGGRLNPPAVPETGASLVIGVTLVEPEPRRAERWASGGGGGGGRGGLAEGPERGSKAVCHSWLAWAGGCGHPLAVSLLERAGCPSRKGTGGGGPARGTADTGAAHKATAVCQSHALTFWGRRPPPGEWGPWGCEAEQREPAGPARPAWPTRDARRRLALTGGRDWLR